MRRNTPKRAAQERLYRKRRVPFLESRSQCEMPGGSCPNPARQVHHRMGRVGALLLDEEHWSALCHDCHRYVTEHPKWAIANGISEPRVS